VGTGVSVGGHVGGVCGPWVVLSHGSLFDRGQYGHLCMHASMHACIFVSLYVYIEKVTDIVL